MGITMAEHTFRSLLGILLIILICGNISVSYLQGNFEELNCIGVWNELDTDDEKKIAITFDDGPHPYYTEQLLDGLAKRKVVASFFVTGEAAENYPDLIRRMKAEGHLIGNHTYSHIQLTKQNRNKFKQELIKTNEILQNLTGDEVLYVRPPYGSWDKTFEEELCMFPVLWNIDPLDWCSDDVDCIVDRVMEKVSENAIILMHDEYKTSVTAALRIVDILQEKGYSFVTIEEILFD